MARSEAGPPAWLDKVKFIKYYFLNGCETTLFVYLETGAKALENAVLSLLLFDMLDLVRGLFRPKGLRSTTHGSRAKKNKGKGKATEAIPELGEIIGGEIRDDIGFKKPTYSSGTQLLWEIDAFTQRGLYFVMIGDVIADFAFDWYSGIIASPESNCALGRARVTSPGEIIAGSGWGLLVLDTIEFEQAPVLPLFTEFQLGAGKYTIIMSARAKIIDGIYPNQDCQLGLVGDIATFEFIAGSDRKTVFYGVEQDFIVQAVVEGPTVVHFYEYTQVGGILWFKISALCFQIAD